MNSAKNEKSCRLVRSLSSQFKKTLSFEDASGLQNQVNASCSGSGCGSGSNNNNCKEAKDVLDLIIKTIELEHRHEQLKHKATEPTSLNENDWREFTKLENIIQYTSLNKITSSPAKYCLPKFFKK